MAKIIKNSLKNELDSVARPCALIPSSWTVEKLLEEMAKSRTSTDTLTLEELDAHLDALNVKASREFSRFEKIATKQNQMHRSRKP